MPVRSFLDVLIKKLCRNVLVLQVKELKLLPLLVIILCDGFNVFRAETKVEKNSSCSRIECQIDVLHACLIALIDFISKSFKISVIKFYL